MGGHFGVIEGERFRFPVEALPHRINLFLHDQSCGNIALELSFCDFVALLHD